MRINENDELEFNLLERHPELIMLVVPFLGVPLYLLCVFIIWLDKKMRGEE